jgi:UDP-glucose 6-dehydrogenase
VLPNELAQKMKLCSSPLAALEGVSSLVIGTEWPEYQSLTAEKVLSVMREPLVIDANRFLVKTFGSDPRFRYVTVGKAML